MIRDLYKGNAADVFKCEHQIEEDVHQLDEEIIKDNLNPEDHPDVAAKFARMRAMMTTEASEAESNEEEDR